MVKISVIVPLYNPPKHFLEDCINSLLQQTLSDIEIILVDNGSPVEFGQPLFVIE